MKMRRGIDCWLGVPTCKRGHDGWGTTTFDDSGEDHVRRALDRRSGHVLTTLIADGGEVTIRRF
jgi:hypothetical protein